MKKYSLFLDTTTQFFYCNCFGSENKRQLFNFKIVNNAEICNQQLFCAFKKVKINFDSVDKIYLTIGPGKYNGIRIGGLISRTWCNIFPKCRLYTISSLRLQAISPNLISVISASKNKKNVEVFQNNTSVYLGKMNNYSQEIIEIIQRFPNNKLIVDYQDLNLFDCFLKNIDKYQLLKDLNQLKLIY